MTEKVCMKCGELKPLSAFYKHSQMKDGHLNKCIECAKKDVHENYVKNKAHYQLYEQSEKRKASRHKRSYVYTKNNRDKYPEKTRAHRALRNAIRTGKIQRPDCCSVCGEKCKVHGHHDDYSKPLDVIWVCPQCHRDITNKRERNNNEVCEEV